MPKKTVEMEHPIAGRSRASRMQKLAQESNDIFQKIDEKEEEKKAEAQKPIESKKLKSLKELLFVGTTYRLVEIDGFVFKLKSLTHQESRNLAKRIFLLSDEEKLIESNAIQVAYALESINSLSVAEAYEELFEEEGGESEIDMALKIISSLNTHLTAKLIQEYFELSSESKKMLNLEKEQEQSEVKK